MQAVLWLVLKKSVNSSTSLDITKKVLVSTLSLVCHNSVTLVSLNFISYCTHPKKSHQNIPLHIACLGTLPKLSNYFSPLFLMVFITLFLFRLLEISVIVLLFLLSFLRLTLISSKIKNPLKALFFCLQRVLFFLFLFFLFPFN